MKTRSITGKIIHLTREIRFSKPAVPSLATQFISGGRFGMGGVGLHWWYTPTAIDTAEDIARMLIQHNPSLAHGDVASFTKVIFRSLEQGVFSCGLFEGDKVWLRTCDCLFDSRKNPDVTEFGKQVLNLLVPEIVNSLDDWLVVYPLCKITGSTFDLKHDGISILSTSDQLRWERFVRKYPAMQGIYSKFAQTPLWIVCEAHGTQLGAQKQAIFLLRKFIAVLFSILSERGNGILYHSMVTSAPPIYHFPLNPHKVGCSYVQSSYAHLLFPLLNGVKVTAEDLKRTRSWYDKFREASSELKSRSATAANFINFALTHRDVERYIHYFISLDALFGSRHRVEKGIAYGILTTFKGDERWAERAEWLFDLRNELIHGGSSSIDQWDRLLAYRKHFKTHPEMDVEVAALESLKLFFQESPIAEASNSTTE